MNYRVEIDCEEDGRWIAEFPEVPDALAYGNTKEEAINAVSALLAAVEGPND